MPAQLTGNVFLIRGRDTSGVLSFLKKGGVVMQGNPDLYVRTYGTFGIDDAHELTGRSIGRSIRGDGRTFVICATGMTTEAQNALLKTIEEPALNARFFFIVPSPETLLATVRSRAQMYSFGDGDSEAGDAARKAEAFLAATPDTRLDLLKPLLEKGDDDPVKDGKSPSHGAGRRDIGAIIAFLSSLERTLATYPREQTREGIHALYNARKYLNDKGALLKPLLESVALLVPVKSKGDVFRFSIIRENMV